MSEGGLGKGAVLLYSLTAVITLFLLVPLLFPIALSFSDTPFVVFPPQGFTLQWYWKVINEPDFTTPFMFSVQLGVFSAIGALILGTPTAIGLVRYSFPGRALIQGLVLSPLVFPMLVTGIALLRLFTSVNSHSSLVNLVIGHTLVTVPYVIRTVSASLLLIDPSTEDAARTLGASRWQTFWRITRPQIVPGLFAGGIFAFVTSFDNYAISMWLADAENFPMPMAMFALISRMFDPGIAAIASLMILMSIVIVVVLEWLTSPIAVGVPRISAPTAENTPSCTLNMNGVVKSGSLITFQYHCRVKPCGGNTTNGVSENDSAIGNSSGTSRNSVITPVIE